jgi:hypothetical protein
VLFPRLIKRTRFDCATSGASLFGVTGNGGSGRWAREPKAPGAMAPRAFETVGANRFESRSVRIFGCGEWPPVLVRTSAIRRDACRDGPNPVSEVSRLIGFDRF